jgi:glycosyltransferase involved in cell wall biosynthesis
VNLLHDIPQLDFENVVIFPQATIGQGGLGRHALEVKDHLESRGTSVTVGPDWNERPQEIVKDFRRWLGSSPDSALDQYDQWCARSFRYPPETEAVLAFPGACLGVFRTAPAGVKKILVTSTFHASTHRAWALDAVRRSPLERPWLTRPLAAKMDREADMADLILSNSTLTTRTFVEAGFSSDKCVLLPLTPRYLDPAASPDPPVDIVYVGALTVEKGVVDLIRAFSQMRDPSLRLRLIGGHRSPGMNAYLHHAVRRDPRIEFGPGDPARQLPSARLLVHPSYTDSFAYAVAEGIAAGLPVVTTDQVGASDLIRDGQAHPASEIIPAGDRRALLSSIEAILKSD